MGDPNESNHPEQACQKGAKDEEYCREMPHADMSSSVCQLLAWVRVFTNKSLNVQVIGN